jgi:hypothetical protein
VIPKIGPSTIAALTAAGVFLVAFLDTWIDGNPSVALAALSAGLTAVLGVLRTWQTVSPAKGSK